MSQPGTKQIAFMVNKYLGFVFESAKCCAVNDAVSIKSTTNALIMRRTVSLIARRPEMPTNSVYTSAK